MPVRPRLLTAEEQQFARAAGISGRGVAEHGAAIGAPWLLKQVGEVVHEATVRQNTESKA